MGKFIKFGDFVSQEENNKIHNVLPSSILNAMVIFNQYGYKFKIQMNDVDMYLDMHDWSKNNLLDDYSYIGYSTPKKNYYIFKSEVDAMAFKLRWG